MKIDDLLIAEEIQHLEELKAGKYAQVASLLGALAAQHGGKAADAASVGYKQQAPHALATLATYADPKKLSALPATLSSDELNKGEDEWKRQRDKMKIGRLIPSLKEGHVQRNGAAFSFRGLRLHFYRDHVFYVVQGGPNISIYKDGVPTPRNDEIYVKDAAAHGVPKDIITIISTWLNTPLDKQEALLPRIEAAMNHIIDGWLKQSAAKKENAMKMEDLVSEGPRGMKVASRDWKQNKNSQASRRGDAGWSKSYRQPGEPSKADLSAMAAKAKADYDKKKGLKEEEDHEASMAKSQLYNACKNAMALMKMIENGDNLEGWVAAKITKAADYINMVHNYMAYEEVSEGKQKGVDGKACWKGYKRMGTKQKGGKTVDNCVKIKK